MGRGRVRRNGRGGWERATAERDSASCGCIAVVTASSQCRRVYSRLQYRERERERERERCCGSSGATKCRSSSALQAVYLPSMLHVLSRCYNPDTPMPRLPASILSVPRSGQDVMHRSRAFLHTSNAGYLFETKPAGKHAAASDGSSDQCIINHARNLLPFFVPKDRDCAGTSWIARGPRAVELTLEDPLICRRRKRL